MDDILNSGCYASLLGYDNVDWFVSELIKLKNRMFFYLKNTKKDIIMTDEDEDFKIIKNCRFCEKTIESDKVRDHRHLTGKYRGPARSKRIFIVTQKQNKFIPFAFHICSNYDCHLFFKRLADENSEKAKFNFIPKTNEEYLSVAYGCIRFIDIYRSYQVVEIH